MNESSLFESFDGTLRLRCSQEITGKDTVASPQKSSINSIEITNNDPGIIKNPFYINQNPCQPIIDFPRDKTGDKRKFNSQYYKEYKIDDFINIPKTGRRLNLK